MLTGDLNDLRHYFTTTGWLTAHHEAKLSARRRFVHSLPVVEPAVILDVACGIGGWTELLAEQFPESSIYGLDCSTRLLSYALSRNPHRSSKNMSFLLGDGQNLPFADSTFDLVFLGNCISYFDDSHAALSDAFRVLRRGGKLAIRNPDDGMVAVHPCSPALNLKVLWAAAEVTENDESTSRVDPYAGRKIETLASNLIGPASMGLHTTTVLRAPFSPAQKSYITGNVRWLGLRARKLLTEADFTAWMSLIDPASPENILSSRMASYTLADYCFVWDKGYGEENGG